jgi:SAM-dependent methyltransferase
MAASARAWREGRWRMIEVLRDWSDVGRATQTLRRRALPEHGLPEKNWDLAQIARLLDGLGRDAHVVDLGCGGLHGLRFLAALGFARLTGIDLAITPYERAVQLRRLMRTGRLPFRLRRCSLTATGLPAGAADAAVALSVLEHGVDPEAFCAEASRILRPGAPLFVSADYWPEPVAPGPALFGLPWTILDRAAVASLIATAARHGLGLEREAAVPEARDRVVVWQGREYTFISIIFRKAGG